MCEKRRVEMNPNTVVIVSYDIIKWDVGSLTNVCHTQLVYMLYIGIISNLKVNQNKNAYKWPRMKMNSSRSMVVN